MRTDFPERRFAPGNVLHCDHPDAPVLTVRSVRPHSGRLLVTFDEVASRDVAQALSGSLLLIDAEQLGPSIAGADEDGWLDREIIGLAARTVDGSPLGAVTDVVHGPGGDLLAIAREGQRELLVPFVREIVPTVDVQSGVVVIDPPPGLLEL